MDRATGMVTAERFASGLTFDEYVRYAGSPENLQREAGWWLGPVRQDLSGQLRAHGTSETGSAGRKRRPYGGWRDSRTGRRESS
jgi:hypothetical protein